MRGVVSDFEARDFGRKNSRVFDEGSTSAATKAETHRRMKKPETVFKEKIRPLLEALPNTWVCKTQQISIRGTPDFLLCIAGHFAALELKKDGKTDASPLQQFTLQRIRHAGGYAKLAHPENWNEIYEELKELAYQEG